MADTPSSGGADVTRVVNVSVTTTADAAKLNAIAEALERIERAAAGIKTPINILGASGGVASGTAAAGKAATESTKAFSTFNDTLADYEKQLKAVHTTTERGERILKTGEAQKTERGIIPGGGRYSTNVTTGTGTITVPTAEQAFAKEIQIGERRAAWMDAQTVNAEKQAQRWAGFRETNAVRSFNAEQQAFAKEIQIGERRAAWMDANINRRAISTERLNSIQQRTPGSTLGGGQFAGAQSTVLTQNGQVVAAMNNQTGSLTRLVSGTKAAAQATQGLGDEFIGIVGKVGMWTAATAVVFGAIRGIKEAVAVFAEVEMQQARVARAGRGFTASGFNSPEAWEEQKRGAEEVMGAVMRLRAEYGISGDEAGVAAANFARMGLSEKQVIEGVRVSMLAANVAGLGLAETSQLLTAAMAQFNLPAEDMLRILNNLNTLENSTRAQTAEMLQAISRTGQSFKDAGGDIETLSAITAVVAEKTGRSGAEIGNAIKTIISRMGEMKTQKAIWEATGVTIANIKGELTPVGEVLGGIAAQWGNLTEAQQLDLSVQVAGVRQRNILLTILQNWTDVQAGVVRQLSTTGSAAAENAVVMDTLAQSWNRAKAAAEAFAATKVENSGLGKFLKDLSNSAAGAILAFNTLDRILASNPLLGKIMSSTFGPTGSSLATSASAFAALGAQATPEQRQSEALAEGENARKNIGAIDELYRGLRGQLQMITADEAKGTVEVEKTVAAREKLFELVRTQLGAQYEEVAQAHEAAAAAKGLTDERAALNAETLAGADIERALAAQQGAADAQKIAALAKLRASYKEKREAQFDANARVAQVKGDIDYADFEAKTLKKPLDAAASAINKLMLRDAKKGAAEAETAVRTLSRAIEELQAVIAVARFWAES